MVLCVTEYLSDYCCAHAPSLVLRRNAKRMQFNVLSTFKRHEKTDRYAAVLDHACVLKLKLLVELLSLFGLVPRPARGRNMNAHGSQKDIFEKR